MKPVRIIVLAVAAVAAIALAVLVRGALSGKPTSQAAATAVAPVKPMARVLVAKRDLKIGDRLVAEDMDWQDWPIDAVNPAFVTDGSVALPVAAMDEKAKDDKDGKDKKADEAKKVDAKDTKSKAAVAAVTRTVAELGDGGPKAQFVGAVVREPLLKGEPLVDRKLVRAGQSGYLAVVLAPGMRAMSVPLKVESGAGGFILPGDRVDILLSRDIEVRSGEGSHNQKVSGTVLRNIKILAIDQTTQTGKDETTVVGATATVEVSPGDAEALALAKAQGELSFTLRSYADAAEPSGRVGTSQSADASRSALSSSVRVFRNGQATEVQVRP
jgi:pilus assembly protein CpaB